MRGEGRMELYGGSYLGRVLRMPLAAVPKSLRIRVLSGANRGLRWIVGAGNHNCWLGTYERDSQILICQYVRPGMIVFDVGAHTGYFTLLLSRLVGETGRVVAFEPDIHNLQFLRRHLALNDIHNVEVIPAAVALSSGQARFMANGYYGRLSNVGSLVTSVRLDEFEAPDFIKMDVEGDETTIISSCQSFVDRKRTTWLVELHGETIQSCPVLFERAGYAVSVFPDDRKMTAIPA